MASTTTPHASPYSLLPRTQSNHNKTNHFLQQTPTILKGKHKGHVRGGFRAAAAATEGPASPGPGKAPPGVDTRIHWENDEDGWIGGGASKSKPKRFSEEEEKKSLLGEKFADLLNESSDSHYQFLGVSARADLEEIKAAYRRLSKEYHPDTTSLPLKAASEKFMKLREVYDTLSNAEKRDFYDWTLAQEAASRKTERMRMEDPYQTDLDNYVPVPDMVDRLDGRNLDLSDQAMSALTFDIFIILFAICCTIYVVYFKEPY
uniref:Chaperone DnaJ-domain superfamily protein n=1 Tax=California macrophylla TaxID=337344 RepID=A0A0F7H101_9ROSI